MTINEFKAWLEGYCEAGFSGGAPNKEQWQKIQSKLRTLSAWEYKPNEAYKPKKEWTHYDDLSKYAKYDSAGRDNHF